MLGLKSQDIRLPILLDPPGISRSNGFSDGLLRKLKARFCVRGDQQESGVDFFETYAPVVSWATVRLMLVFSILLNLETKQVDYTSAFVQAPIDTDVYISLPSGWKMLNHLLPADQQFLPDHVLKLNRSVYGLCQSPKNFFAHLKSNLEKSGFQQSLLDPCVFYKQDCICLTYVDDCLFFSPKASTIDDAIAGIESTGMQLEIEDSVAGFLGVHINQDVQSGKITLTQLGLIDRIISSLGLSSSSPKKTPSPVDPLPQDLGGEPFDRSFNYASVVGMLMYLSANSRPDIAFAVNQCARHSHHPTRTHAEYLKHIGRYLKGTKDQGLVFSPDLSQGIEFFADADFAGLWKTEDCTDPHCVRSRTGYVILVAGCPVLWVSKLQSLIALSTMESKYIALSTACRDLLPLQDLVNELKTFHALEALFPTSVSSTIWEDNVGALTLANMDLPRMTPRSKHIAVKYHWFRIHVQSGKFSVKKVGTSDQLADIFTKGLAWVKFEGLRLRLVGW